MFISIFFACGALQPEVPRAMASVALLGALATLALVVCPVHGATSLPWISADGPVKGFMTDEAGRVRIFHGVNAVNKGFPW